MRVDKKEIAKKKANRLNLSKKLWQQKKTWKWQRAPSPYKKKSRDNNTKQKLKIRWTFN